MGVGNKIREIRNSKGMTQQELADMAKLDLRTIQRIENEEVVPRSFTLKLIAQALDTDASEFLALNFDPKPPYSRVKLMTLHLSGILLLPTLLLWYFEREQDPNVNAHGKDIINFQLSMLSILIPCLFLPGLPPLLALFTLLVVFANAILVYRGKAYFYPLSIRIIK